MGISSDYIYHFLLLNLFNNSIIINNLKEVMIGGINLEDFPFGKALLFAIVCAIVFAFLSMLTPFFSVLSNISIVISAIILIAMVFKHLFLKRE